MQPLYALCVTGPEGVKANRVCPLYGILIQPLVRAGKRGFFSFGKALSRELWTARGLGSAGRFVYWVSEPTVRVGLLE